MSNNEQLKPAEIIKFCKDCVHFVDNAGPKWAPPDPTLSHHCAHPKVGEAWQLVHYMKPPEGQAPSINAEMMRLFWCGLRGVFWQRAPAKEGV